MSNKTIIAVGSGHQLTAVHLRHPLIGCPAVATPVEYYYEAGRNVGLVLLFPDGHQASLTYTEIRQLRAKRSEE